MPAWHLHGVLGSPTVFLVLAWQVLNCWATLLALPACLSFPTCKQQTQCLWQDNLLPIGRFVSCPRQQHGAGATVSPGLPHVPSQFRQVQPPCVSAFTENQEWLSNNTQACDYWFLFSQRRDQESLENWMIIVLGRNCNRDWRRQELFKTNSEHVTTSDVSEATWGYWGHVKDTEGSFKRPCWCKTGQLKYWFSSK